MTKIVLKAVSLSFDLNSGRFDVSQPELTIEGKKSEAGSAKVSALLQALLAQLMGEDEGKPETEPQKNASIHPDEVVNYVRDNPGATIEQIAKGFNLNLLFATHVLAHMSADGKLVSKEEADTVSFTVPAKAADDAAAEPTAANVLAFLGSDDRFEYRTLDALRNKFGEEVDAVIRELATSGQVIVKDRRSDGEALYKVAPAATADTVLAFLRSDTRYQYRTKGAIAKHFGANSTSALTVIDSLIDDGLVTTKRQRRGGDTVYKAAAVPTETAAVVNGSTPTTVDVLAFLRSDDRFEYRSYGAINKHFRGSGVDHMLGHLVANGDVITKYRRADGETLYKAVAILPADGATSGDGPVDESSGGTNLLPVGGDGETSPTTELAAVTPSVSIESVRAFLTDHPRYSKRTLKAIAQHHHIGEDGHDDLSEQLDGMVNDGDICASTRRRDGATLYSLA